MKGILLKPWKIEFIAEHPNMELQTRRVIKLANKIAPTYERSWVHFNKRYNWWELKGRSEFSNLIEAFVLKPRYQVGETVYIKEAWYYDMFPQEISDGVRDKNAVYYRLDGEVSEQFECWTEFEGWRSPLFMPEWAARYFIVITDVRAERLQEITEEDAIAEGIKVMRGTHQATRHNPITNRLELVGNPESYTARYHYEAIWNSINAKWKRVYNPKLKIYEFWQFPWCEADARLIPKTTQHPERYHCVPNPWVFAYTFEYLIGKQGGTNDTQI